MTTQEAVGLPDETHESAVSQSDCCNSGCTVCVLDQPVSHGAPCLEESDFLEAIRLACEVLDGIGPDTLDD